MGPTSQKEQFSVAYLHALASVAGLQLVRSVVDDDSVDVCNSLEAANVRRNWQFN